MTQTEVSVIIPVHNGAKTVQMAVDSVLRQKIPVQIIVIDDASTDALEEALLRYRELPFFKLLKNEKNMGVAASRMRGVNAAQTEYVAFLDADDWWRDDKLSKQLAKLQAQAEETRIYEEKIHHLADQMIEIDLDDGVKHNYAIFKDVLAKIK